MHPDLEKMIVLQGLDVEARRLGDEITALPKRVAQLAADHEAAKKQLAATVESLAKEETLRRRQELDIKDHQQKAARLRKQMDVVTTTAQASALEHEITFAETEVSRLEDAELESMERTEQLEAKKADAEETVANLARRHAEESAATAEALTRARALRAEVESQRIALRPQITPKALTRSARPARCSCARSAGTTSANARTTRPCLPARPAAASSTGTRPVTPRRRSRRRKKRASPQPS